MYKTLLSEIISTVKPKIIDLTSFYSHSSETVQEYNRPSYYANFPSYYSNLYNSISVYINREDKTSWMVIILAKIKPNLIPDKCIH